ncbi:hypothetical protein F5877DRAFT_69723 [Lentinula edodes]|nr:hypothetical protein F5877DRAFT_69723 [Lentinula edodes]
MSSRHLKPTKSGNRLVWTLKLNLLLEPLGTKPKKPKSSPHAAPHVISKKKTAATQRNRPSNGTHQTRYRAVAINVDEEEVPPLRKWRSHNNEDHNTVATKMVAKEAAEESASENDVDESDIEIEQERTEDQMAAHLFEQETPRFTMFDEDKEEKSHRHRSHHSRASSQSSSAFASTPPLTDFDGTSEPADDSMDDSIQDDRKNMVPVRKISKKAAQKLDYELPQVSTEALPAIQMAPSPVQRANSSTLSTILWKDRTNINAAYQGRSWILSLTSQPAPMRKVIDRAIKEGKADLLMGHEICPLEPEGLKHLALKKLVKAADFFGWDGAADVAHRLEEGDHDSYVKPLTTYVSSRIGNERARELKGPGLNIIIVNAYGFTGLSGPSAAQQIILTRHFMYGLDSQGNFDDTKPFQHKAYVDYIRAVMFGNNLYSGVVAANHTRFISSIKAKPLELEVTKGMVAMATAGIHAMLQDYANGQSRGKAASFPLPETPGIWTSALSVLNNIERVNLPLYHKIMHELYLEASGAIPLDKGSMTQENVFDTVNWAALAAIDVDQSNNSAIVSMSSPSGPSAAVTMLGSITPVTAASSTAAAGCAPSATDFGSST